MRQEGYVYMRFGVEEGGGICTCRFEVRKEGIYVHAGFRQEKRGYMYMQV